MADIKLAIVIDAAPEKVYPLIATARGLSQWWAADMTEAGDVELGFFRRATVYRLQLVRAVEPREAEWQCVSGQEWNGTRLVFELKDDKGKALLRFRHADWKSETDYFVMCTATWGELMYRLKATAEGKSPGPLFSADGLAY
ncbi:MAG TPA: SRPBCC domain-containing protein [Candidatus Cybelea sp.]|nr:SRPBCC domain-containing protein [Candidatus Cybelea sp.]